MLKARLYEIIYVKTHPWLLKNDFRKKCSY